MVADIEKAKAFYEGLGANLVKQSELNSPNEILEKLTGLSDIGAKIILMKCANVFIEIFEFSSSQGSLDNNRANMLGIRHIALETDDIDKLMNTVKGLGGSVLGEIVKVPGAASAVYCVDPFGNILELIHPGGAMPALGEL